MILYEFVWEPLFVFMCMIVWVFVHCLHRNMCFCMYVYEHVFVCVVYVWFCVLAIYDHVCVVCMYVYVWTRVYVLGMCVYEYVFGCVLYMYVCVYVCEEHVFVCVWASVSVYVYEHVFECVLCMYVLCVCCIWTCVCVLGMYIYCVCVYKCICCVSVCLCVCYLYVCIVCVCPFMDLHKQEAAIVKLSFQYFWATHCSVEHLLSWENDPVEKEVGTEGGCDLWSLTPVDMVHGAGREAHF